MSREVVVFWTFIFAGSTLAGWWLAVRPSITPRDVATPVAFLIVVLAVLLCLLALCGTSPGEFAGGLYQMLVGG